MTLLLAMNDHTQREKESPRERQRDRDASGVTAPAAAH